MDVFDLESVAPAGSPVITQQPTAATAPLGGNASFTVATSPAATTYTWSLNGNTISDGGEFSGSATATLKITGVSTNDVGHYQVLGCETAWDQSIQSKGAARSQWPEFVPDGKYHRHDW
jgi:hypothetical protein